MSRFLVTLLLIALLPLRGWTVERMPLAWPAPPAQAAAALAHGADAGATELAQAAAMPPDCAMHMHAAADGHDADARAEGHAAQGTQGTHKGCESCQLCMPLAAPQLPQLLALAPAVQVLPATTGSHFASADVARDHKPPIS